MLYTYNINSGIEGVSNQVEERDMWVGEWATTSLFIRAWCDQGPA